VIAENLELSGVHAGPHAQAETVHFDSYRLRAKLRSSNQSSV
jgi:hypothetical protein